MSEKLQRDHQYAFDIHGKWVNAKQIKYSEHITYFCECPEKHKMKLVKPSGLCGKRPFCDYFAHIRTGHKKHKSAVKISCSPGGESLQHRMAKHKLREMVGFYYFSTFCCQDCSYEKIIDSERCSVSMEVASADKQWRYDCLLLRNGLPEVALEVFHRHLTGFTKVQSVRKSGIEIAEFRADDVMSMLNDGRTKTKLENIQIQTGKCQDCLLKASYMWIRDCFVDDLFELIRQEDSIIENYELIEELKREKEMKIKRRNEYLLKESNQWIWDCFVYEIREIQRRDDEIARCSVRDYDLKKALQISDPLKKCKVLLTLSLDRLEIDGPLIGNVSFEKAVEWTNGLLVSDFDKSLPTKMMCIFLVADRSIIHNRQWKHQSVESIFHIFLNCSTILRKLSTPEESPVVLKNCMWPILKEVEASHGFCANCGYRGHVSDDCHFKFCVKCGRKGHLQRDCFARRDVLNQYLI
jgi:hypothetical protein